MLEITKVRGIPLAQDARLLPDVVSIEEYRVARQAWIPYAPPPPLEPTALREYGTFLNLIHNRELPIEERTFGAARILREMKIGEGGSHLPSARILFEIAHLSLPPEIDPLRIPPDFKREQLQLIPNICGFNEALSAVVQDRNLINAVPGVSMALALWLIGSCEDLSLEGLGLIRSNLENFKEDLPVRGFDQTPLRVGSQILSFRDPEIASDLPVLRAAVLYGSIQTATTALVALATTCRTLEERGVRGSDLAVREIYKAIGSRTEFLELRVARQYAENASNKISRTGYDSQLVEEFLQNFTKERDLYIKTATELFQSELRRYWFSEPNHSVARARLAETRLSCADSLLTPLLSKAQLDGAPLGVETIRSVSQRAQELWRSAWSQVRFPSKLRAFAAQALATPPESPE